MKDFIMQIGDKVIGGGQISFGEALQLVNLKEDQQDEIETLLQKADEIREKFMGNNVDLCSIMNVKSGKCSENCKFCAQSAHYHSGVDEYDFLDYLIILEQAKEMEEEGVHRFSLVSSGRGLSSKDTEKAVSIYQQLSQDSKIKLCASHGIISYEQALALKKAGVSRYHHNVESGSDYYKNICTTHSYEDRIATIKNAQSSGLDVCCGGIIGLGESPADRVQMAFEIKALGVKSIPINVLNPIPGTPLGNLEILAPLEILKTVAVFRYINPDAHIRYAGGRNALASRQNSGFRSGVNAAIVGNYLTTVGNNIKKDKAMIKALGLEIQ
jgi:biotin synthase